MKGSKGVLTLVGKIGIYLTGKWAHLFYELQKMRLHPTDTNQPFQKNWKKKKLLYQISKQVIAQEFLTFRHTYRIMCMLKKVGTMFSRKTISMVVGLRRRRFWGMFRHGQDSRNWIRRQKTVDKGQVTDANELLLQVFLQVVNEWNLLAEFFVK